MTTALPSGLQQVTLILLRTLIGWHFAWEGFVKLWWPSWSRGGWPLGRWSATGYLQTATGPLQEFFRGLADSRWMPVLDMALQANAFLPGRLPVHGVAVAGTEGNYLFVNKNLIEAAALLVLLVFRTGRIAGFDLLLAHRRQRKAAEATPAEIPTEATP